MSLLKVMARSMVCWCLLLGVNAVTSAEELLPMLGWAFFYSLLAGINWYVAED